MQIADGPDTIFLPRILATPSRLRCRFGWNAETTRAFAETSFEELQLWGGADQSFILPDLGPKALEVTRLTLGAAGNVSGLDQFSNVETLNIEPAPPINGVDLSWFGRLRNFGCQWHPKLAEQLPKCMELEGLDIVGYAEPDAHRVGALSNLRRLSFTQGRISRLNGLDLCTKLEAVSLAYVRALTDIDALKSLRRLESLDIENAPRLNGSFALRDFPNLRVLRVVSTPLVVDLSDLSAACDLEVLWLNGVAQGLDWNVLFSIRSLRKIAATVGPKLSNADDAFRRLAANHNRALKEIVHVGPAKSRQVQLALE